MLTFAHTMAALNVERRKAAPYMAQDGTAEALAGNRRKATKGS